MRCQYFQEISLIFVVGKLSKVIVPYLSMSEGDSGQVGEIYVIRNCDSPNLETCVIFN